MTRRTFAARHAVATMLLLPLAACASTDDSDTEGASTSTPAASSSIPDSSTPVPAADLAGDWRPADEACPPAFSEDAGAAPRSRAADLAVFEEAESLTLCSYQWATAETSEELWQLVGDPVTLGRTDEPVALGLLRSTKKADPAAACTMELGPRLVVTARGSENALAVIDTFGCRRVRLLPNLIDGVLASTEDDLVVDADGMGALDELTALWETAQD